MNDFVLYGNLSSITGAPSTTCMIMIHACKRDDGFLGKRRFHLEYRVTRFFSSQKE